MDPGLRTRFELYGRYAALLEGQLEALGTGDFERFEALAHERDAVAAEVDETVGRAAGALAPPAAAALLADSRATLRRCLELDGELQSRLRGLRDDTLQAVRALDERAPQLRSYLGSGREPARLDVRL